MTESTEGTPLLPCPFCGEAMRLSTRYGLRRRVNDADHDLVTHDNAHCPIDGLEFCPDEWNRRANNHNLYRWRLLHELQQKDSNSLARVEAERDAARRAATAPAIATVINNNQPTDKGTPSTEQCEICLCHPPYDQCPGSACQLSLALRRSLAEKERELAEQRELKESYKAGNDVLQDALAAERQARERAEQATAFMSEKLAGQLKYTECVQASAEQAEGDRRALVEALRSIAANSCCDKCQEAALVARAALKGAE